MIWLGFEFNTLDMTITIPPDKLIDVMDLAQQYKKVANNHELMTLLGKLFHIAQCCPKA